MAQNKSGSLGVIATNIFLFTVQYSTAVFSLLTTGFCRLDVPLTQLQDK